MGPFDDEEVRRCSWCRKKLGDDATPRRRFCSNRCYAWDYKTRCFESETLARLAEIEDVDELDNDDPIKAELLRLTDQRLERLLFGVDTDTQLAGVAMIECLDAVKERLTHTDLYATTGTYRNMLADVMIAAEQLCDALVGHGPTTRQITSGY